MASDPKAWHYQGPGYWDDLPAQDIHESELATLAAKGWTEKRIAATGGYRRVGGGSDGRPEASPAPVGTRHAEPVVAPVETTAPKRG